MGDEIRVGEGTATGGITRLTINVGCFAMRFSVQGPRTHRAVLVTSNKSTSKYVHNAAVHKCSQLRNIAYWFNSNDLVLSSGTAAGSLER